MKKTIKLLLFAAILTLFALIFTALSVSASVSNVVYISADGTGDGSSPDKPLGNSAGYKPGNKMETHNAFYLGLSKLKDTGGTLVIVGDVSLDCVESRFASVNDKSVAPSEFRTPKFTKNVSLTVTSVYNGVDYRKNGAELILDHETCNTTAFAFGCSTTIKDIDILYKYHPDFPNSWNTTFMLCGGGYNFNVDTGVKVSSLNVKTNTEGDRYPLIVGGHRYMNIKQSYSLTVKSGTWEEVIGGSYGIEGLAQYGQVTGNVSVFINGGKIQTLTGTGSLHAPSNTVNGTVSISVTGGEIEELYASHYLDFTGSKITLNLEKSAKIGKIFYAPETYEGNPDSLIKKVEINNHTAASVTPLVIQTPTTQPPATQPPATQPQATQPLATQPPETQPETTEAEITEETMPETQPETQLNDSNLPKEDLSEDLKNIFTVVLIIGAVIGIGSFILNIIKEKMIK